MITDLYQQQLSFLPVTQEQKKVEDVQMLDSNYNSLTKLGNPEITSSQEVSSSFSPQVSSSVPQASNFASVRCIP